MPTFRRQLKQYNTDIRRGLIKQMRKDMMYLLKPCPKHLPKFIWMWLLKKLLNLKPESINIKQ